jgi:hypothetical protein
MKWLLFLLALAGCSHNSRLDCIEHCKDRGLKFIEVVDTTEGYDPVERETKTGSACRCGYGKVPQ